MSPVSTPPACAGGEGRATGEGLAGPGRRIARERASPRRLHEEPRDEDGEEQHHGHRVHRDAGEAQRGAEHEAGEEEGDDRSDRELERGGRLHTAFLA